MRRSIFVLSLLLAVTIVGQQGAKNGEWRTWGGDGGNTRYSSLDQVTAQNVKNLKVAWVWKSDNFGAAPEMKNENTPLMVNGVLYFAAGDRRAVIAADPATGETLWAL
jgi:quinoprotein glucose dehydrogenase